MIPLKGLFATVALIGAGAYSGIQGVRRWFLAKEAKDWMYTDAIIRESFTYKDPARKNRTHFRVKYEFVAGKAITGLTPRISGDWFLNNSQQQSFVDRYKEGDIVPVYYSRHDPTKNCLDKEDRSGIYIQLVLSAASFGGAALLYWLLTRTA